MPCFQQRPCLYFSALETALTVKLPGCARPSPCRLWPAAVSSHFLFGKAKGSAVTEEAVGMDVLNAWLAELEYWQDCCMGWVRGV